MLESPIPFVFRVEKRVCDEIDRYCAETGEYRSCAEFARAASDAFLQYSKEVKLPLRRRTSNSPRCSFREFFSD